ncbi:MAG: hypothetical protein DRI23_02050 [Candidatus Cloacimonadota bacterium]|nr:MAG: hypothetical protein DRI23_02050 [Candidatus Cloacimonadota bacterium]
MKLSLFKSGSFLILLVFCLLLIPISSHAAVNEQDYVIQGIQTYDIPDDDGSGLMISWKPLPKERRIIEYRVYRGITPDSLFYIGKIDVNVKTGVMGDAMYFYDTDFNYFLDTQASGKLKKEKGQPKGSPLYRRYPRDINVVGPQLSHYSILSIFDEKSFYYKSQKVEVPAEEEGEDPTVYAGLKLRNFTQFAKKLLPDHEYYYTVIAVNEARKYFPNAEPVVGIPRENSPENPKELYSVFVEDINRLQFEWNLATFADDHWHHSIYMMHKNDLDKFNKYYDEQKAKEINDLEIKEGITTEVFEPTAENPAQLIFRRGSGYPYTPIKTAYVDIVDGRIIDEENDIDVEIDPENIDDYVFVFSFDDLEGYESFSPFATAETITSADLPEVPAFTVSDKPDDKGDYNLVKWGKPTVFLTNSNYLGEKKNKLLVSYDYKFNDDYKVRNIYFRIFDENGNEIDYVNEFQPDMKIIVKLPEDADKEQSLTFEMSFRCNNPVGEDYSISQKLTFDDQSKSLVPGPAFLGDENLSNYEYYVYKKNYTSPEFRLSKKIAGTERKLSDNIRHGVTNFKIVNKFDAEKKLFLFSPTFSIQKGVSTNLFLSEIEKTKKSYKEEIDNYTASKDTLKTDTELAEADDAIKYYTEQLASLNENPILKKADSIADYKQRIKYLQKVRQYTVRSFEYKIIKSDGKARFKESPVLVLDEPIETGNLYTEYLDEWGTRYFMPWSNWFKMSMLPTLLASLIFGCLVFIMINKAKKGHDLYVRPIAGIQEIDNAIGRATEMGKPILFVPGTSSIGDVATLAGLAILSKVAKKAAEYDTKILVPCKDYLVLPIAQEIVKEAHYEAGRPDTFDKESVFFITSAQFAFVAGVNGIMIREKTATNFYMGMFWAEALLMTETGSSTGAIQISGTDAITQIPFFITTCDYTLIGEELYAASAYMAREPKQLGTLKAVDYLKLLILVFIISGTILSTSHLTFLMNALPEK